MSKYNSLWEYVRDNGNSSLKMTFEQIQQIAGIPIDHSFLKYKKELTEYGYVQLRTSEHRSMYSYVRLSIDRCTATYV